MRITQPQEKYVRIEKIPPASEIVLFLGSHKITVEKSMGGDIQISVRFDDYNPVIVYDADTGEELIDLRPSRDLEPRDD